MATIQVFLTFVIISVTTAYLTTYAGEASPVYTHPQTSPDTISTPDYTQSNEATTRPPKTVSTAYSTTYPEESSPVYTHPQTSPDTISTPDYTQSNEATTRPPKTVSTAYSTTYPEESSPVYTHTQTSPDTTSTPDYTQSEEATTRPPRPGYDKRQHLWLQSDSVCRVMMPDGGLPSIHKMDENYYLANLAYNVGLPRAFIGLFYHKRRGLYEWQDGTPMDFSYWDFSYPKYDEDEGCVFMDSNSSFSRWQHKTCYDPDNFFCKAPAFKYYLNVRSDSVGCPKGFEGYGDYCYHFYPDVYTDTLDHYYCYRHNQADDLWIASHDENEYITKRMMNLTNYQKPGPLRIKGLKFDADTGFYWDNAKPFKYHNFNPVVLSTKLLHSDSAVFMKLKYSFGSYGGWIIDENANNRPQGIVCKKMRL